ncbi:MAG: hypothetical protein H6R15_2032 [Proteobacteria bacterium]|nr:hypothetical protein [Pseudomonadota bacterium]
MDELNSLAGLGWTLPTPAYLIGALLFGIIGFAAYRYGKRMSRNRVKWIGVALMLYPYAISGTAQLYAVGTALCLGLYIRRD